jgi:hypothetical protein
MLYGFGDVPNPLPETVELVEELVTDYVTDLVGSRRQGQQAVSVKSTLAGPNREPRSQNVKWMLSERETVVSLPFAADRCPCVEKLRTVSPLTVGIGTRQRGGRDGLRRCTRRWRAAGRSAAA